MSSFWREGRRGQGTGDRRKALALILLVACSLSPVPCAAGPYSDLDAQLAGKPDSAATAALERIAGDDEDALAALDDGPRAARAYIALRATLEGVPPAKAPSVGPLPGDERIASSWLSRALSRFHWPEARDKELSIPRTGGHVGSWVTTLMWSLIAALGAWAAFALVRYARLPRRRKNPLVDPEEPIRSSDAWLEEANGLIAQGRYRDAVRGLYVAGLMRFDEAGVARFDRHQTNWEHLRRIEASPKTPPETDTRAATGRFDSVWYGHIPATLEDATTMRAWYDHLVVKLAEARP